MNITKVSSRSIKDLVNLAMPHFQFSLSQDKQLTIFRFCLDSKGKSLTLSGG